MGGVSFAIHDELKAENVRLRKALKPFADALTEAEKAEPVDPHTRLIDCRYRLTLYEFQCARMLIGY